MEIPTHANWDFFGSAQEDGYGGGCLAGVRRMGRAKVVETWLPFDGFVWIRIGANNDPPLWLGGAYVPGPSDPKFRSLQGDGKTNHFDAMNDQLLMLSHSLWALGVDFNSVTGSLEVSPGPADPH